ncbi:helix-turn-helix domain-containing protein [Phenylobacterium sp. CCH12-B4]|uniref:helix-turn-helix domain-containing protein n=1 Tax=Phenylobacterium sp. CCH12-B4 TaxID=1768784 RepID=UPI0009E7095A|nr:helix-turn-helix transcriptional regulator [Phenylobacterium sp. CCH12-B4]
MSDPSRPQGSTGEFVHTNTPQPHPFDVAVGRRLRMARKARSLSQGQLAESIGLSSHQQIQKYEQGANRISASSLAKAAIFLGVPIDYFFVDVEGMPLPACEFHAIAGTNSTARWARIPREGGHGFHGIMGAL